MKRIRANVVLAVRVHDLINHVHGGFIMDDLTETDCRMDDFYKAVEPQLKARLVTDALPAICGASTSGIRPGDE